MCTPYGDGVRTLGDIRSDLPRFYLSFPRDYVQISTALSFGYGVLLSSVYNGLCGEVPRTPAPS